MFRFAHPYFLYGLIIVPIILIIYMINRNWKKKALARFGDNSIISSLMPDQSPKRQNFKIIILLFAYTFLILGIADLQVGSKIANVKAKGIDLIIALDVSNSMLCEDVTPNRLERAKQAISKIIENMGDNRIGLVVFAGQAYTQLPITTDYYAAKMFLSQITTDMVPTQGTDIGEAIRHSVESFGTEKAKNKAIVIITDGENFEDEPIAEAKNAVDKGIAVYTIGIGLPGGGHIPVLSNGIKIGYKKDKDGNTVVTKIDDNMLQKIAAAGNGAYFRMTNSNAGLNALLEKLDKMEKKETGSKIFTEYEDRFQYFILPAFILLILEFFIFEKKNNIFKQIKNLYYKKIMSNA
ncbi:MAG: VWA domain-containing protein [Bacteroidota bacterium]|nr:VWA domain-containing protein [Bacteroidota bacterium]